MDTSIITYIQKETNTRGLHAKNWQEIVDNVVLPKMAGKGFKPIKGHLLNFMAMYSWEIRSENLPLYETLLKICLQRVSKGAIPHDGIDLPPIEDKYAEYSSAARRNAELSLSVANFLLSSAMTSALNTNNDVLKKHALAILFSIVEHISPDGIARGGFKIPESITPVKATEMREKALSLITRYATWEEMFEHFVTEDMWKEHIRWLSENYSKIDWKKFFKKTNVLKGNLIQKWFQKRRIKKEIEYYSLLVAGY